MSKSSLILLFLLSIGGLLWSAHGNSDQDLEYSTTYAVERGYNVDSDQHDVTPIPPRIFHFLLILAEVFWDSIINIIALLKRLITIAVSNVAIFLSKSDDTTMARFKRSTTDEEYRQQNVPQSSSLASMLSRVFLTPFKITLGIVGRIPVRSIYNKTLIALTPLEEFANSPPVRTVVNTAMVIAENASARIWDYTKVNVLPVLDNWITNLDKSESMPEGIMKYLKELQTLYHVCHMVGIA